MVNYPFKNSFKSNRFFELCKMFFLSSIENHKVRETTKLDFVTKIPELHSGVTDVHLRHEASFNGTCRYNAWKSKCQPAFFLFSIPSKEHFIPQNPVIVAVL
jgi:hypothetical protein